MAALFIGACVFLVAVLLSGLAHRSVLSTAALFLGAGFVAGGGLLGVVHVNPETAAFDHLIRGVLFAVLFTDGMKVNARALRSDWHAPARALGIGMPITFGIIAFAGHGLGLLDWPHALLTAAVLTPTDPVFAEAIVGRDELPARLKRLLNVESGMNDGLALPVVLVLLEMSGAGSATAWGLTRDLLVGLALGGVGAYLLSRLLRVKWLGASARYEPFRAVAVGLLIFAAAELLHANEFLAAFTAGLVLSTTFPEARESFAPFGELLTELAKLTALFFFGAVLSPTLFQETPWTGYLFAAIVLLLARPAGLLPALVGTKLNRAERAAASWFGAKGFASVLYGLYVLRADVAQADRIAQLVGVVVTASMLLSSSTDVPVGRWLHKRTAA